MGGPTVVRRNKGRLYWEDPCEKGGPIRGYCFGTLVIDLSSTSSCFSILSSARTGPSPSISLIGSSERLTNYLGSICHSAWTLLANQRPHRLCCIQAVLHTLTSISGPAFTIANAGRDQGLYSSISSPSGDRRQICRAEIGYLTGEQGVRLVFLKRSPNHRG